MAVVDPSLHFAELAEKAVIVNAAPLR